jgi:hypothetical protein
MTQRPDKPPLLPTEDAEVVVVHASRTGQGPQTSDECQKGLVPQAEVDKQTHIVDRHYSDAKFD